MKVELLLEQEQNKLLLRYLLEVGAYYKFINNCDDRYDSEDSLGIETSFQWRNTPEGHTYWDNHRSGFIEYKNGTNGDKTLWLSDLFKHKLKVLLNKLEFNMKPDNAFSRQSTGYICDNTLNTTKDKPITNGKEGGIFIKGSSNTKIKLGKILKQITDLDSTQIEKVVSEWKKIYTLDITIVKEDSDVCRVYDIHHSSNGSLGGSCMRHLGSYMDIYEDIGCRIAYIEEGSALLARCLIWEVTNNDTGEAITCYDRIFSSNENSKLTLDKYCSEKGYYDIHINKDNIEVHSKSVEGNYYEDLPYIDTLYQLDDCYRLTNYDDSYGEFQKTEGSYTCNGGSYIGNTRGEDDVYCEDIEEWVHVDDAYYCEGDGVYYGSDDNLIYMSGYGCYRIDSGDILQSDGDGEWYFTNGDMISTEDGYNFHMDEYDEYFYCDDCCGYQCTTRTTSYYIEDTEETVCDNCIGHYHKHDGLYYREEQEDEAV